MGRLNLAAPYQLGGVIPFPISNLSTDYMGRQRAYKGTWRGKGKAWTHTQWIVHSAGMLREGKSYISNPKDKGWQFRTPEQFAAEQAIIKVLKKKWWEQEKAKRTPRKKSGTSKASPS